MQFFHFILYSLDFTRFALPALRKHVIQTCEVQHAHIRFRFRAYCYSRKWNFPHGCRFLRKADNHRTLVPFGVHIHDEPATAVDGQYERKHPPQSFRPVSTIFKNVAYSVDAAVFRIFSKKGPDSLRTGFERPSDLETETNHWYVLFVFAYSLAAAFRI